MSSTAAGLLQVALLLAVLVAVYKPLGDYMASGQIGQAGYLVAREEAPDAAGSYSCTWFIGNDKVSGDLQLTGARGPKGAAFEVPGVWTDSSTEDGPSSRRFRPHTVEMPVLRGRLRPNHDVLLVDAKVRDCPR